MATAPKSTPKPPTSGPTQDAGEACCSFKGCKKGNDRFGFCGDHFEQYKFGLITKHGARVEDYEKKFEHYAVHKAAKPARKVA